MFEKMKRKKIVTGLFAILLLTAIAFVYLISLKNSRQKLEITLSSLENYYKKFDIEKVQIPKDSTVEKWHQFAVLKNKLYSFNNNTLPNEELYSILKKGEEAFYRDCKTPAKCTPCKSLAPYCILKKRIELKAGKTMEEIKREMPEIFKDSLNYWSGYFQKQETTKEDLRELYCYLVVEDNCGDVERVKQIDFIAKIININKTEFNPIERANISFTELKMINKLGKYSEIYDPVKLEEIKKNNICKLPKPQELVEKATLCDTYNYYKARQLCESSSENLSQTDYGLIIKQLEKRPSEIEEIICQIGLILTLKSMIYSTP